jgi:hypothetical protein
MTRISEQAPPETQIVALWATPRSISTAFLKTFCQRGDTAVIMEPFADVYNFSHERRTNLFGDNEALHGHDRQRALRTIQAASAPLVFFKDMAYHARHYIDKEFLRLVTNTFILRAPEECMASIYKGGVDAFSEEEFGFESLYQLWNIATQELGQPSIIVEATRFRRDPERVLRRYCEQIGVDFMPQMLAWEPGRLKEWQPHEIEFQAKWHEAVEHSTTILPPTSVQLEVRTPVHQQMLERPQAIYAEMSRYAL